MANSKAYLSFVLLFAFLLSSHVLAHELRETSPKESIRLDNAEVDELKESKSDWTFPRASRKTMLGIGRGHYTHSVGYDSSRSRPVQDTEPEKCEDGDPECDPDCDPAICGDGDVLRPSKFDWRTFPTFPVKNSGMRHGGKTGYGVPRKEDVGGETMN